MVHNEVFRKAKVLQAQIEKLFNDCEFYDSCLKSFSSRKIKFQVDQQDPIAIPCNTSGIYIFWADFADVISNNPSDLKMQILEFLDRWDLETEKLSNFPKSNRSNANKYFKTRCRSNRIPFYVGKSEKISARIQEHLYLRPESATYALKLSSRNELLKNIRFEINWIPFETTKNDYLLVSRIECLLRNKLTPIIGKT